jgi:type II secretory pathway pseudopilin PulG
MRCSKRSAAFSLVELLVATAVAVLVIGATTGSVLAAQRLENRAEADGVRLAAAATLWERLRSLPFCSPGVSVQGTLTQTVFPRAETVVDDAGGRLFVEPEGGCPAGTFFTTMNQDGLALRVAATFCVAGTAGFTALPLDRLAAYSPLTPPAGRLLVRVRFADDPTDLVAGVLPGTSCADGEP